MPNLSLIETETQLSYTGSGELAGFSIVIQKDDTKVDVHQITPIDKAGNQTWQSIRNDLIPHLI